MDQAGVDVPQVRIVNFVQSFVPFFQLRDLQPGEITVEMSEADAQGCRAARWNKQSQPSHHGSSGLTFAAGLQPEQAKGQGRIHRSLGLLLVYAENSHRAASLSKQP